MVLIISYRSTQPAEQIVFSMTINDVVVLEHALDGRCNQFQYELADLDECSYLSVLISLRGKTQAHTVVDDQGRILQDCAVLLEGITIDGIDVTEIFCQGRQCYQHDANGTLPKFLDEFYGYIGCNGDVSIQFELPLYKWFLKHCQ